MNDPKSYAPPALFHVNTPDTSQHILQVNQNTNKGKGVGQLRRTMVLSPVDYLHRSTA